jgi:subtilisin family serine protease
MCCCPPLGLVVLRRLLAGRHDIVVHPADALASDEPGPDVYFYRPGEVLVPVDQVPLLVGAAARLGIRVYPISDPIAPCQDKGDQVDSRPAPRSPGPVARYAVLSEQPLDVILDRLERATTGRLRITPNHVIFACPKWGFDPATEPIPTAPEPRPARVSDANLTTVKVAVIDNGLPVDFVDNPLVAAVPLPPVSELESWGYAGPFPVLRFPQGHAMAVTGMVCQTSARAQVASYRALDVDGITDEWALGLQIDDALDAGPAVINLSLGTYTRGDQPLLGLDSLRTRSDNGSFPVVVAAAGNGADDRPFYPAADDWVIGVGAVDLVEGDPVPAWFTNWGSWVDVCARGVDIDTAYEAHPYRPETDPSVLRLFSGAARWSGTSFAAPAVSGVVADLLADAAGLGRDGVMAALGRHDTATTVPGLGTYVPWPE